MSDRRPHQLYVRRTNSTTWHRHIHRTVVHHEVNETACRRPTTLNDEYRTQVPDHATRCAHCFPDA